MMNSKLVQAYRLQKSICTDTRKLKSGDLFFALKGPNFNGNLFAAKALLLVFIVIVYFFYRYNIGRQESFNIIDLLWKIFVTGLIATVASLASTLLLTLLKDQEHGRNPYFLDTLYQINVGLIITFLIAVFTVWKRLISLTVPAAPADSI